MFPKMIPDQLTFLEKLKELYVFVSDHGQNYQILSNLLIWEAFDQNVENGFIVSKKLGQSFS